MTVYTPTLQGCRPLAVCYSLSERLGSFIYVRAWTAYQHFGLHLTADQPQTWFCLMQKVRGRYIAACFERSMTNLSVRNVQQYRLVIRSPDGVLRG